MNMTHLRLGPIQTNCYIVWDDTKNAAVIDPAAKADKIDVVLKEHNLNLQCILLTHMHFDHIGGINGLRRLYPDVKVYIGTEDAPDLPTAHESWRAYVRAYLDEYTGLKADVMVEDGDVIEVGSLKFHAIATPGHTRGGRCYLCEDAIFTGDTLFKEEVGRCDLDGGDYLTILRSVKKLAALEGDYTIYPGHEAFSTLSHEREHNRYIRSTEV